MKIQKSGKWLRLMLMALIMVIKGVRLNRTGKASSLNQLSDSIDTEMIQNAKEKVFLLAEAETFPN